MAERKTPYNKLPEIPYGTKPVILLVGNGITLSFPGAQDVDNIIKNQWLQYHKSILPGRDNHCIWKLPFTMQVVTATEDHVQSCMEDLAKEFRELNYADDAKYFFKEIVNSPCDILLSTNYSLEFEKSLIEGYTDGKAKRSYRITQEPTTLQTDLGIFQCTELPNSKYLWHIHGTALRKKSMVMGQWYYGKLLSEVTVRAQKVNTTYRKSLEEKIPFKPMSWIDYFLIGDLHIFGFGLDYSEIDIWWLLSYKKANFTESKTFFYEPKIKEDKKLLLDCYKVETPNVLFKESEEEKKYINYYKRVMKNLG